MPDPVPPSIHKETAKTLKRDSSGHFLKVEGIEANDNLAVLKLHNPLKKFEDFIDSVRKNQTIPIDWHVKTHIPFTAWFLAFSLLFGFGTFQLGKIAAPVCPTSQATRLGVLYVLTVDKTAEPTLIERLTPWVGPPSRREAATVAFLEDKTGSLTVKPQPTLNLAPFHGQKVAVSGRFNVCSQTLDVDKGENVTLLQ